MKDIQTERKKDLACLNKWKNSKETYQYLGGGFNPILINQQEKWLDSLIEITDKNKRYIICLRNIDQPIGMIGLYDINWINRVAEEHGKGYAREAYYLLEDYTNDYLNLRKLKLNVVETNDKAKKMWEKFDYKVVGKLSKERYVNGTYQNLLLIE
ncbi:GNAT family N-acetyltransferase [Aerococcus urinaeequi]|uniref:GNAT family N-acetyltransferase n=1 Tax=Aerococcus urinaeequi TaxID=51665 RepID=UPI000845E10D|nr:GNAT family N-acetyltransferase [Aerococcus urinaeequi]